HGRRRDALAAGTAGRRRERFAEGRVRAAYEVALVRLVAKVCRSVPADAVNGGSLRVGDGQQRARAFAARLQRDGPAAARSVELRLDALHFRDVVRVGDVNDADDARAEAADAYLLSGVRSEAKRVVVGDELVLRG